LTKKAPYGAPFALGHDFSQKNRVGPVDFSAKNLCPFDPQAGFFQSVQSRLCQESVTLAKASRFGPLQLISNPTNKPSSGD